MTMKRERERQREGEKKGKTYSSDKSKGFPNNAV
jgi:hypothetical protein